MALPWVRLDSNIASHDKILGLLDEREGYRAAFVYVCALGWCGGQATDGFIPKRALPMIHGLERHARLLVDHGLWEYADDGRGWLVRNWSTRQQTTEVTEHIRGERQRASVKGNCVRHHGPDCNCWRLKALP